ncbi:MAG: hypothetical protein ACFFG0_00605 [Candidatus Thorarchaeota archaeon]
MRKYKFKVVNKRTNKSCMVHGNSKYSLLYEKDTNVYADEGTLGIMVFKTRKQAENWIGIRLMDYSEYIIKRVIPIGRGKVPKQICADASSNEIELFNCLANELKPLIIKGLLGERTSRLYNINNQPVIVVKPIPGTICYPGVYVVD